MSETRGLKDHEIARLVNVVDAELTPYINIQCLREAISRAVTTYLTESNLRIDIKPDDKPYLDQFDKLYDIGAELKRLGWRQMSSAPSTDTFECIEMGSTGIHKAVKMFGSYWILSEDNDLYPADPILWRPICQKSTH